MKRLFCFLGLVFTLGLVALLAAPQARPVAAEGKQHIPGTDVILVDDPRPNPRYIPQPAALRMAHRDEQTRCRSMSSSIRHMIPPIPRPMRVICARLFLKAIRIRTIRRCCCNPGRRML